jgi:hypothetical protein
MRLFVLLIFIATSAFCDPITVTILDQTVQTSASAYDNVGIPCNNTGSSTATCLVEDTINRGTYTEQAGAYGSATVSGSTLQAYSSASANGGSVGNATASITDKVLITGGTGTGYLNLDYTFGGLGPYYAAGPYLAVNGQFGHVQTQYYAVDTLSGVFAFTFGQPFTYTVSLFEGTTSADTLDWAQLSFFGARLYTSDPGQCYFNSTLEIYGLCSDPNYSDISTVFRSPTGTGSTVFGSPTDAPEPNTGWMLAGFACFPAINVLRRFRR